MDRRCTTARADRHLVEFTVRFRTGDGQAQTADVVFADLGKPDGFVGVTHGEKTMECGKLKASGF